MNILTEASFAHSSTFVTTQSAFGEAIRLLTRLDWGNSPSQATLILGERKTNRVTVLVFSEEGNPPWLLATAMERIASMVDPSKTLPVLAHQVFDVDIFDVPDQLWSTPLAVRLSRLSVVPTGVAALTAIGRSAIGSLKTHSVGFMGAIGLTHAPSGKAMFVEIFSTRAALRESEVTAYFDARAAREAGILVEPPEHEIYQSFPLD